MWAGAGHSFGNFRLGYFGLDLSLKFVVWNGTFEMFSRLGKFHVLDFVYNFRLASELGGTFRRLSRTLLGNVAGSERYQSSIETVLKWRMLNRISLKPKKRIGAEPKSGRGWTEVDLHKTPKTKHLSESWCGPN